jgi:hypothetical protein
VAGFNTETVTVIRPPVLDQFGDPVPGTSPEHQVGGVLFAPGSSDEAGLGTNQVITDGAVYGPADMDVRHSDRILIRGDLYEVIGKPQRWGTFGTVAAVRLYNG